MDDPVNLAAIKFTTRGKTPRALDTPIGEKDKVENFTYIVNHPNDSVSIKLSATEQSAIFKTPAKRKRSTRTLDSNDNMSGNVINTARKPPYPLHDHCYCIQLGNTIQPKISPKRCIIESKHYKKTKMEENCRRDKSQIQSKTPLDGCSSTVPVMPVMRPINLMILPTLNVPIMLSKSDMDYSGSGKQIFIEKSELDKKCSNIQMTKHDSERKRRSETKALFQDLRDMIPEFKGNERTPKIAILKEACKLIHDLRKEFSDKERHLHELALESRSLSLSLKDLTSIYMKKGLYGEKS